MSQLILQPFRCFTYIASHSPTLLLLHLCHSSFSNRFFASPTSWAFHLRHLASRPWWTDNGIKFVAEENGRNPMKNLPRLHFIHHETHMEWPRCKLRNTVVGGEHLTACTMERPFQIWNIKQILLVVICVHHEEEKFTICLLFYCGGDAGSGSENSLPLTLLFMTVKQIFWRLSVDKIIILVKYLLPISYFKRGQNNN